MSEKQEKVEHGNVHYGWAVGGVGERVWYRLEAEGYRAPIRELTLQQAESFMLNPDRDYTPKDGILNQEKWVNGKKLLAETMFKLEKTKPGRVVDFPVASD